MGPYSRDLRQRVAAAVDQHEGSLRQIAGRFRVSTSSITRLLSRRRANGSLDPKPHGGGQPPALDQEGLKQLRRLVRKRPDATLEELKEQLGADCSLMAIFRALRRLKITFKKKNLHASERDSPRVRRQRRAFREEIEAVDPKQLVFVDETGANTAMTRRYGRAPRGERVRGSAPGHWDSVTLICGPRLSGVVAPLVFQGATDTPAFLSYVEQALVPRLRPGDVVIWDNLKPHKAAPVVRAIEGAGAQVVPLPTASPDLTPIEKMFSKLKGSLRTAAARTTEAVTDAMGEGLRQVCPEDILGWFRSCGWCEPHGGQPPPQGRKDRTRSRASDLCATQK
jgi:transposase